MESTPSQKKLVAQLLLLKEKITKSSDRKEISNYIRESIQLARPVDPIIHEVSLGSKAVANTGKMMIIEFLNTELQGLEDENYYDLESIHFQISASLLMLMLKFVDRLESIKRIELEMKQDHV